MLRPSDGESGTQVGELARRWPRLLQICVFTISLGFGCIADAQVFRASELSKGTWDTPGYAFALSLSGLWSVPVPKRNTRGYGFTFAPSFLLEGGIRLGLDLSYHFLREPIGGLQNAMRLWSGWDIYPWYQTAIGVGFAREQRNYDVIRTDIPKWIRNCRRTHLPHILQRNHLFFGGDGDYRWGPGAELMAGYGVCQSEERDKKWRRMWAAQLFFTFAWR